MNTTQFFSKLERQFQKELPFAVYHKPNDLKTHAIFQETATLHHCQDFTENGFVFAPFDLNEARPVLIIPDEHISLENEISTPPKRTGPLVIAEEDTARNAHIQLVNRGIQEIEKGVLKKVVLSRKRSIEKTIENPIVLFKKLHALYPAAFTYCWFHPKVGLWLGASPERLIAVKNQRLVTTSLAGTVKVTDESKEVVWGAKEREEQQLVTDSILAQLTPLTEGITSSGTDTHIAGTLAHLKTDISAQLKDATSLGPIIQALHPTPAVCGLPKKEAKTFIIEHEGYQRSFYTGFLGELNLLQETTRNPNRRNVENGAYRAIKKETTLFVNLRCMEANHDKVHIYVGGGITALSNPEREWVETVDKTATMLSVLG